MEKYRRRSYKVYYPNWILFIVTLCVAFIGALCFVDTSPNAQLNMKVSVQSGAHSNQILTDVEMFRKRLDYSENDTSENSGFRDVVEKRSEIDIQYKPYSVDSTVFNEIDEVTGLPKWYVFTARAQYQLRTGYVYDTNKFEIELGFEKIQPSQIAWPHIYDKFVKSEIRDVILPIGPHYESAICLTFEAQSMSDEWYKIEITGDNNCKLVWQLLLNWCYISRSYKHDTHEVSLYKAENMSTLPPGIRFSFNSPATIGYYSFARKQNVYFEKMWIKKKKKKDYGKGFLCTLYVELFHETGPFVAIYESPYCHQFERLINYYESLTKVYPLKTIIGTEIETSFSYTYLEEGMYRGGSTFIYEPESKSCFITFGDDSKKLRLNKDNSDFEVDWAEEVHGEPDYEQHVPTKYVKIVVSMSSVGRKDGIFQADPTLVETFIDILDMVIISKELHKNVDLS